MPRYACDYFHFLSNPQIAPPLDMRVRRFNAGFRQACYTLCFVNRFAYADAP
jgi:hypothetical protein